MTFSFDANAEVILINAALFGPTAIIGLVLALDTGATNSLVRRQSLLDAGYDLARPQGQALVAMGSGVETLPLFQVQSVAALGQFRDNLTLVAHDFPSTPQIDGVLGLDFLRRQRLTLDFRAGELELV
ncbi:MAG: retropepsin-like domain-containing protein [Armatimonadetes bacterium]|nr:retropepsin-like domain-containing protein [Armatimonadota bacterium]